MYYLHYKPDEDGRGGQGEAVCSLLLLLHHLLLLLLPPQLPHHYLRFHQLW